MIGDRKSLNFFELREGEAEIFKDNGKMERLCQFIMVVVKWKELSKKEDKENNGLLFGKRRSKTVA